MYQVNLYRPESNDRSTPELNHLHGVMDALGQVASQRVKVYRTYVPKHDKWTYILTTTSKDVHLSLGALSQEGQLFLAGLLHLEFVKGKCSELLLFEGGARNKGALVTLQSTENTGWCFHLSPAH
jgi:hypothetical protein